MKVSFYSRKKKKDKKEQIARQRYQRKIERNKNIRHKIITIKWQSNENQSDITNEIITHITTPQHLDTTVGFNPSFTGTTIPASSKPTTSSHGKHHLPADRVHVSVLCDDRINIPIYIWKEK